LNEAAPAREISLEAFIEKEPVTVIMSQRGWIKAMKGHADLSVPDSFKFKEGDGPKFAFHAQTTDKLLMCCDNGRFYTLGADKLPGARGFGEPVGSMVDLAPGAEPMALMVADMGAKLLLASTWGRGFVAKISEVVAETKKGRQVTNLKGDAKLLVVRAIPAKADHVAAIGENRKLVVFALSEMPEMAKGQGVMLQRYKDGGMSDATIFKWEEGLSWAMGGDTGRTRTEQDLTMWRVARGAAGRLPPTGFPKSGKFD
jgi:topoisomerase-4 subunit A